MTNTDQKEYLGVLIYAALLGVTICLYVFVPVSVKLAGFLLILWSFAALFRALWFLEITAKLQKGYRETDFIKLPQKILEDMKRMRESRTGKIMLRGMGPRVLVWLGLMALYVVLYEMIPPAQNAAANSFPLLHHPGETAAFLIIGFAFWLAQTYAYTRSYSRIVLGTALAGLALALAVNALFVPSVQMSSFAARLDHLGWSGTAPLYAAGVFTAYVFLRTLLSVPAKRAHAIAGIALVGSMALCDLFFTSSGALTALFLAGWAALGGLWGRCARSRDQRRYELRQP